MNLSDKNIVSLVKSLSEWLDDYANFEDRSVGIEWLGKLDKDKVDEIKESFEGSVVLRWDESTLVISMPYEDTFYRATFKLVDIFGDSSWVLIGISEDISRKNGLKYNVKYWE